MDFCLWLLIGVATNSTFGFEPCDSVIGSIDCGCEVEILGTIMIRLSSCSTTEGQEIDH